MIMDFNSTYLLFSEAAQLIVFTIMISTSLDLLSIIIYDFCKPVIYSENVMLHWKASVHFFGLPDVRNPNPPIRAVLLNRYILIFLM